MIEMKMTEADLILSFEKSCEERTNEVCFKSDVTDTSNDNDITKEIETSACKLFQKPMEIKSDGEVQNAVTLTQEDSDDKELAVNSNAEHNNLCNSSIDQETKEIDDDIREPDEIQESEVGIGSENENMKRQNFKRSRKTMLANALIKRSIKCLNKMHVMEDVHEGCDTQPSSPGHAEQRPEISEIIQLCAENHISTKEAEAELEHNDDEKEPATGIIHEKSDENQAQVNIENVTIDKNDVISEIPNENNNNHVNEDSASSDSNMENCSLKRKLESELAEDSASKKIQLELQKNFLIRDKFLNRYMESLGCSNLDQIQSNTEKILIEIKTLNELAKEKEREWNHIIHLKKIKEELLLRLQRQKQLLLLNFDDYELQSDTNPENVEERCLNNISCDSILKQKTNAQKCANNNTLERNQFLLCNRQKSYNGRTAQYNPYEMNGPGDYRQNKQRPTLDVKSIIADYRQRHPETVPRRGRRIRSALSQNEFNESRVGTSGILNLSNIALGSGAQVRHNTTAGIDISRELGLLLSSVDEVQKDNCRSPINESLISHTDPTSFKDMLVQFAKLSQNERQELLHNAIKPPPPYPEVTVHPVPPTTSPSSSLLHGILTKSQPKPENKNTFSPTLARLLTAPEKSAASPQTPVNQTNKLHGGIVSISDILSSSKARNEITITPVGGHYDLPVKVKQQVEDDEAEDSVDRLVIDEGGEIIDSRSKTDNNSDAGDEVPQCQGCNQKPAQFVCAGCGNQWYCSRDCQVSAWDEHSEVCSG